MLVFTYQERERSDTVEINLGCRQHDTEHTYRVFVTTFLGFGANEALARHRRELILEQLQQQKQNARGLSSSDRAEDPCLPSGMRENATVTFGAGQLDRAGASASVDGGDTAQVFLLGTGRWDECYGSLARFTKERERFSSCEGGDDCPDAGMKVGRGRNKHQCGLCTVLCVLSPQVPPLHIEDLELYGFSEFWYSMEDVLKMGGPYSYEQYRKTASVSLFINYVCKREWASFVKFSRSAAFRGPTRGAASLPASFLLRTASGWRRSASRARGCLPRCTTDSACPRPSPGCRRRQTPSRERSSTGRSARCSTGRDTSRSGDLNMIWWLLHPTLRLGFLLLQCFLEITGVELFGSTFIIHIQYSTDLCSEAFELSLQLVGRRFPVSLLSRRHLCPFLLLLLFLLPLPVDPPPGPNSGPPRLRARL